MEDVEEEKEALLQCNALLKQLGSVGPAAKVKQPEEACKSPLTLYFHAKNSHNEYEATIRKIGSKCPFAEMRVGPLKKITRVCEKAILKYNGSVATILDLNRGM